MFYRAEARAAAAVAVTVVVAGAACALLFPQQPLLLRVLGTTAAVFSAGRYCARGPSAAALVAAAAAKVSRTSRQRVIIVTGANCGIGFYSALRLSQSGAAVIITCRSIELLRRTEEALQREHEREGRPNGLAKLTIVSDLPPVVLDDFASVRRFAAAVVARFSHLDVLVNNAGMINATTPVAFSAHAPHLEVHTAVNFLGPVLMTQLLLPLLRRTPGARVVHVASEAHKIVSRRPVQGDFASALRNVAPLSGGGAGGAFRRYGASKLCNMFYSSWLSEKEGVTSVCLHPGVVASNFALALIPKYVFSLLYFASLIVLKSSDEGAQTTVHCALCPVEEIACAAPLKYYIDCRDCTSKATGLARSREQRDAVMEFALEELRDHLTSDATSLLAASS